MGGCRCTYKNCTMRSDGKTHLFHYPVFDKVRCHEWLSKAGRYDFLNLKVSQLKNRCICQHHFTDDWFMNDKKEKLKSKAVPTLDGPFCDSSKFKDPEMPQNMLGLYPLACEVIENDDFILDRKSNYNVLYADFLTNGDAIEPLKISEDCQSLTNIENVTPISNNYIIDLYTHKTRSADSKINSKLKKDIMDDAKEIIVEVPALPARESYTSIAKDEKPEIPQAPFEVSNANVSNTLTTTDSENFLVPQSKKTKVKIISEKKITAPEKDIRVPIPAASFVSLVKPSMVLSINKNKSKGNACNILQQCNSAKEDSTILNSAEKSAITDMVKAPNNDIEEPIMLNNSILNPCKEEESITQILSSNDPSKFEMKINLDETMPPPPTPPKVTSNLKKVSNKLDTVKNKMSPEKLARINEKRKFNMKLKDIIAEELSRLEEQTAAKDKEILVPKKKLKSNKLESETVRSSLAKDPCLPNDNAYIVHYLEARMEKMENLLLNKIDQNTKKIMDLKKTLDSQENIQPESKKISTEPNLSEEAHKKQLYQEISKYLTPNSNSLIYEELFINKYDPNESNAAPVPTKRRKSKRRCLRS